MKTKIKLKTSKGHAPKIFLQVYRKKYLGGWGWGWGWRVKKWKEIWQLAVCVGLFQIII